MGIISELMLCVCGCGNEIIPQRHHKWKPSKFIHGHNRTGGEIKKGEHRGIKTQFKKDELSANWRGGKIIDDDGYVLVWKPKHPYCDSKGYVREHRLFAEEYLDRYLEPDEVVHHINGNKQDNKIDNLQVMTQSEHAKLHNFGK